MAAQLSTTTNQASEVAKLSGNAATPSSREKRQFDLHDGSG